MTDEAGIDAGLASLVAWIEAETGLCFPEVHHETIRKAAARRCAELGLGPGPYEALIASDRDERTRFLDRILIGETYFFRDERQFKVLVSSVLPDLLRACRDEGRELRLWSATCATGEEALSLAAAAEEARSTAHIDVAYRVMASDLNSGALEGLASGRFPLSSFRTDGKSCHPLLERLGHREGDWWVADPAALGRIETRHLNVLKPKPFAAGSFDVVMFRNTLVYMQQARKDKAVSHIVETIRSGGCLFLASPEVPSVRHPLLDTVEADGVFYFSRRAAPAAGDSIPAREAGRNRRVTGRAAAPYGGTSAEAPRMKAASPSPVAARQATAAAKSPAGRTASAQRVMGASAPVSRIGAADLSAGLALASRWLLEPGSKTEGGAPQAAKEAALAIEAVIAALHGQEPERASGLIDAFEGLAGENHVSQYLRGLVARLRGKEAEAVEFWERSRTYEPAFWPALFQAGSSLEREDAERGRGLLIACVEAIRSEADPNGFAALLDGFNSSYYRRMAERLLARSRGK